jgi:hypothetical protein
MSKLNPANITYALTADTNIIHVWATASTGSPILGLSF